MNWIPITDPRRPQPRQMVIIAVAGHYWLAVYDPQLRLWDCDTRGYRDSSVTHWAEITPPNEHQPEERLESPHPVAD